MTCCAGYFEGCCVGVRLEFRSWQKFQSRAESVRDLRPLEDRDSISPSFLAARSQSRVASSYLRDEFSPETLILSPQHNTDLQISADLGDVEFSRPIAQTSEGFSGVIRFFVFFPSPAYCKLRRKGHCLVKPGEKPPRTERSRLFVFISVPGDSGGVNK